MAILLSLPLLAIPVSAHPAPSADSLPDPAAPLRLRCRPVGQRFRQGWLDSHPKFRELDARLPHDHLARLISRAVDTLDLADLFATYGQTGSQAFPPDLLLKVVLYELHLKQRSPKLWAKHARENEPLRWLARGLEPSQARCYAFRQRLGPLLLDFNEQVLHWAIEQDLTPGKRAAQDGSTIAANASRHTLLNEKSLQGRLDLLEQACAAAEPDLSPTPGPVGPPERSPAQSPAIALAAQQTLAAEQIPAADASGQCAAAAASQPEINTGEPVASAGADAACQQRPWWMAQTPAGRERQQQRYQQAQERLDERLRRNDKRAKEDRLPRQRVVISPGDSEAVPGQDKLKVFRPLYNVQFLIDLDTPLILSYQTFAQSHDGDTLVPVLKRAEQLLGQQIEDVLADSAYATGPNLADAEEHNVRLWAPWQSNDLPQSAKAGKTKQISKDQFVWLEAEQTYQCPQGHQLDFVRERQYQRNEKTSQLWEYRCAAEHCRECPRQRECARNPESGRTITRNAYEEEIAALRARMATAEGKELYRLRKQTVERAFADSKEHRGLTRFSGHGLEQVEAEIGLTVLVHNLLTVLQLADRRADEAQRSPQIQTG